MWCVARASASAGSRHEDREASCGGRREKGEGAWWGGGGTEENKGRLTASGASVRCEWGGAPEAACGGFGGMGSGDGGGREGREERNARRGEDYPALGGGEETKRILNLMLNQMRDIDIRGSFESDDEVGGVFNQLKDLIETYNTN